MIRKLFLYTDLFAEPVSLSIQGQTSFRTIWGATLSSFLLILLIFILWNSVQDYQNGTIKKVLFSEIYESNSNYILDSDKFIYEINIFEPNATDENFDKHIQVSFMASNGSHDHSLLFNKSKLEDSNNIYYKYSLLPNQKFEIRNNISFRSQIKLLDQASVTNFRKCYFVQFNSSSLFKVEIRIQSSLINQQNAFETFIQSQNVILTKSLTKIVPIEVRRVKRQEELELFQYLPPPTLSFYSTIQNEQIMINDPTEEVNLLEIQVILNNIIQCYNIEKFGILDIMSGFGGIYQFIFTFILLILRPLNKIMQRYILIKALFDFSDEKVNQGSNKFQKRNALSNNTFGSIFKSRVQQIIQTKKTRTKGSQIQNLKIFIQNITQGFQNNNRENPILFELNSKGIQERISSYFNQLQKEWTLPLSNYIKYRFFCCIKRYQNKRKHLCFVETNIRRNMDIYYIIRKLSEIDKLKTLLLSDNQVKLFDYLPKQVIDLDNDFQSNNQIGLLQQEVPNFKSLIDAQQAYQEISKTEADNIINKHLMKIIDPEIIDLFKISTTKTNEPEIKVSDLHLDEKFTDRQMNNELLPGINLKSQIVQQVKYFTAHSKLSIPELTNYPLYDQSPNLMKTPSERKKN